MKRIVFAFLLAGALSAEALAGPPLVTLLPDANPQEAAMYEPIQDNQAEVKIFLATRRFVRDYERNPSAKMPKEFAYRYTLNMAEQVKYFQVALRQGAANPFS